MTQPISFADLNLSETLLSTLSAINFLTPSPIQAQTIPHLLEGKDLIGQAQTGTGKTAAFALPIIEKIDITSKKTQALVLAPTRELAIQVAEQIKILSGSIKEIKVTILYGGHDYRLELSQLKDGAQIVVGTPGRILDHIERKSLNLGFLETFVLDEADEMLRMGFIEDVETILSKLPEKRQVALFSATMPPRIRQIANRYLKDPISIEIKAETATHKTTEQRFLFASPAQKPDALCRILSVEEFQGVIVFVRTKTSAEEVSEMLQTQGFKAVAIHGDISQALRERVINQFRQGSIDILVATDVAARGLDVERVTHVINYDIPFDCETYVHRIGRTGRAGRSGVTVLFITPRETRLLTLIEKHTRQRVQKINIPSDEAILEIKQQRFIADIQKRLASEQLLPYRQMLEKFIDENTLNPVDVAAALCLMCNKDKPWQRAFAKPRIEKSFQSEQPARERSKSFSKGSEGRQDNFKRKSRSNDFNAPAETSNQELFRIDVGRIHGVKPGNIVGAIANEAGLQSRHITGLKIQEDYSTVKLPQGISKEVLKHLNKAWVCGRQLNITSMGVV